MRLPRWGFSLVLLGLAGCGGDPDASIALVPVKGTVTLNGKPLPNATVSFIPDAANKGGTAGGDTTGPEGNYMATFRGRSGLAPGKYKVTIVQSPTATAPAASSEAFAGDPFMAGEAVKAKAATSKTVEIKGEFTADVEEKGSVCDFDVKASTVAAAKAAGK